MERSKVGHQESPGPAEDLPPKVVVQRRQRVPKEIDNDRGAKVAQSYWLPAQEKEHERNTDQPGFESWWFEGLNDNGDNDDDDTMPKEPDVQGRGLPEGARNDRQRQQVDRQKCLDQCFEVFEL